MRFLMMVKANADSEAGIFPSRKLVMAMGKFNEEMISAGVMLSADGLKPSSQGAKVQFKDRRREVIDGPFTETKELVAGFWIIQADSLEEAIGWAKRAPFDVEDTPSEACIEIRPIFEPSDFPPELFAPEAADQAR